MLASLAPLPLCRLLDALKIFDEVIPAVHDSVISYSCFIPILSIPYLFSLHDEEDYQLLRKSIIRESLPEQKRKSVCSRLRVALNWQGNIEAESPMATHRERSFQLSDLESVDSLRHVDLVVSSTDPRPCRSSIHLSRIIYWATVFIKETFMILLLFFGSAIFLS